MAVNRTVRRAYLGGLSVHTISAYVRTRNVFSAWLFDMQYTKTNVLDKYKRPKLPETVIEVIVPSDAPPCTGPCFSLT
jgi:hypothetical protein